ncbi:AAA family ATPase [Serratia marcescens]|uniref:AAA family ATPase n=1 Tax=Serratia marcescens TaxID=615 RepID=UPI000D72CB35|nr:ATP-binding protein [Serratia marcescens]AWO81359.1 AAA family ATPase [Serratia marcescens]BEM40426.1 ATPase [Serratia marcescens]CAI1907561.1 ATP-dependent zinc metalloprotease FtsH [Serratia marcescens]
MARADLVLNLVETGMKGDLSRFKITAEAIAAEATARHQYQLADKLKNILTSTDAGETRRYTYDNDLQNAFYEIQPRKILGDLIIPESVTIQFMELIEEHTRRDLLRSYNLEPRHKLLLSGPPGNGKTSIAEALANHLSLPFFTVKYEGIINRYLGETAQQIDKLFEFVKTQRCVLFFDEFDAIGKEREDVNDNGEMKRVVNSLLKQIDLLPSHVVVVGATNHESMLDKAIWRRFQLQITVPAPTQRMATKWFEEFEKRVGHSLGLAPSTLARKLSGLSFAELEEFALDVQRKYVLGLPASKNKLKDISAHCLKHWTERYRQEI